MITFIYLVSAFFGTFDFSFWTLILTLVIDFVLLMFMSLLDN